MPDERQAATGRQRKDEIDMTVVEMGEKDGVTGGVLKLETLLNEEQLNGKCGLYARCTLEPGATLNHHEHHGETETYFILSGSGVYEDNGTDVPAKADDVFFCKDGNGHGITNTGDVPLVFMALIIKG